MRATMPYKLAACGVLLAACAALVVFRFVPAMDRVKQARGELARLDLRSEQAVRLLSGRQGGEDPGGAIAVPSEPDLPAFVAAARQAQSSARISGFSFETARANLESSGEITDLDGSVHGYVASSVGVTFTSDPRQAAEFLDALAAGSVGLDTESLRLSREAGPAGTVSVSAMVTLYGIPR
jgi:hypothetical protein